MPSSVGANRLRASRSHSRQKEAPPRKQAGTSRMGFAVRNRLFTRWGTATPTKEMGPAKVVTQADRILEKITSTAPKARTFRPILLA